MTTFAQTTMERGEKIGEARGVKIGEARGEARGIDKTLDRVNELANTLSPEEMSELFRDKEKLSKMIVELSEERN